MKTDLDRRRAPVRHQLFPSLSDDLARVRELQGESGSQPEDTFWIGYVRLIAFILVIVITVSIV